MPDLPYILGNEISGHIADANGTGLQDGQPVYLANWDNGYKGGLYAEYVVAAACGVRRLPDDADLDRAAALGNYIVAQCLLDHAARGVQLGSMVVHGAAGGMGTALTELGRLRGADVIGIAGSTEKCALAQKLGARAINHTTEDVPARVRELTGGRGADLVCNHLAGNTFRNDMAMLAPFGLIVSYGALNGLPEQDVFRDMRKNIDACPGLRCFTMHAFDDHPDWRDRCTDSVMALFAEKKIAPVLGPALPLSDAAQAHHLLEQRGVMGKIVLRP